MDEKALIAELERLALVAGSLGVDKRFQVTRRLLEAAAWRIAYKGEPDGQ